jgi:hypothetical protein
MNGGAQRREPGNVKGVKSQNKQGTEVHERHLPLHKGVVIVWSLLPSSRHHRGVVVVVTLLLSLRLWCGVDGQVSIVKESG